MQNQSSNNGSAPWLRTCELLGELSLALSGPQPATERLAEIYRELIAPFSLDFAFHAEADPGPDARPLVVSTDAAFLQRFASLVLGPHAGVQGLAGERGRPLQLHDVQERSDVATEWIRQAGLRAYASYPLWADGRIVGTLAFGSRSIDRLGAEALCVLDAIHGHVTLALQRRQERQSHRLDEQRLRLLVSSIAQADWEFDAEGRITGDSSRWRELTGQSQQECTSGSWMQAVHPDDQTRLTTAFDHARSDRVPFECECRLRTAEGSWRWSALHAAPMQREDGSIIRWAAASIDLTESKASQAALADTERRREEFLAVLAHELRNPLAPIRSGLELLQGGGIDEAAREKIIGVMTRQMSHMTRLVDDIIDASRIRTGKLQIRRQHVRIAEVLEAAIDSIRPAVAAKQQKVDIKLDDPHILVDADPVRLTQVFSNILNNAVKHAPVRGRVEVTVRGGEAAVDITVEDDGPGIPDADLPHIFRMFVQSSTQRADEGLGIGLALVDGLVRIHGGTVQAGNRAVGTGASIQVRLPLAQASLEGRRDEVTVAGRRSASDWLKLRVLVVDDNIDAAEAMATLLEIEGHTVRLAFDGPAAVQEANDFAPHLIFMDLGLPGFSGLEATQRIRALHLAPRPRIVALTGWGQPSDLEKSAAAGCDDHLVKPVEFTQVLKAVDSVERTARPAEPSQAADRLATGNETARRDGGREERA
jgi:PAS domain S-box-containing protein